MVKIYKMGGCLVVLKKKKNISSPEDEEESNIFIPQLTGDYISTPCFPMNQALEASSFSFTKYKQESPPPARTKSTDNIFPRGQTCRNALICLNEYQLYILITCLRKSLVFLVILSIAEFSASLLSLRPAWKTRDKEVNRYSGSQSKTGIIHFKYIASCFGFGLFLSDYAH